MRGVVLAASGLTLLLACRDPTQITLEIHTDAACDAVAGTAIFVGTPGNVENVAPAATTSACTSDGDIGSLVLVPRDSNDLSVGVRVALSVSGNLDECLTPDYGDSCIIARRSLRYIEHTPLTLPMDLSVVCQGTFCDANTTCINGECVDASVDPNDCTKNDTCDPGTGGAGGMGAGGAGAGGGDVLPCGPPRTTSGIQVAPPAGASRNATVESGAACSWGVAWAESPSACARVLTDDGMQDVHCEDHAGAISDLSLAHVAAGVYAVAAWGGQSSMASVWRTHPDGLKQDITVTDVSNGALAGQNGELVMVNETTAGNISYRLYELQETLSLKGGITMLQTAGQTPEVSMGGDVAVAWFRQGEVNVRRFDPSMPSTGFVNTMTFPGNATSALAHTADDKVGLLYHPLNGMAGGAELRRLTGTTLEEPTVVTSQSANRLSIAGTSNGWAVAYVSNGTGYITVYDTDGVVVRGPEVVATNVAWLDVAARAEQLGVVWIDDAGVNFRYVRADLDGLP